MKAFLVLLAICTAAAPALAGGGWQPPKCYDNQGRRVACAQTDQQP